MANIHICHFFEHFAHYEVNVSHVTLVDKGNVHQINASVDIKLLAKFQKAERNGST